MKLKKTALAVVSAAAVSASVAYGEQVETPDCLKLSSTLKSALAAQPSLVLEKVEALVAANESCACEIVKAAIVSTEADKKLVGEIVRTASLAAPDQMRVVAQCAVAVAPDAVVEVQKVLAELDPGAGESYSAKGGLDKGGEVGPASPGTEEVPSPLDGPGVDGGLGTGNILSFGEDPEIPITVTLEEATPGGSVSN